MYFFVVASRGNGIGFPIVCGLVFVFFVEEHAQVLRRCGLGRPFPVVYSYRSCRFFQVSSAGKVLPVGPRSVLGFFFAAIGSTLFRFDGFLYSFGAYEVTFAQSLEKAPGLFEAEGRCRRWQCRSLACHADSGICFGTEVGIGGDVRFYTYGTTDT